MNTHAGSKECPRTVMDELSRPYALSEGVCEAFRRQGYIKLKSVLSPEALGYFEPRITAEVKRLNRNTRPMGERDTYQKAFLQVMNIWRENGAVKSLVFSRRLAGIAASLMGVRGVRLYHDQALYKESGGGHTPWHPDQFYWPLETANTVTVWIPLQSTPLEMGPLAFSPGSHRLTEGRDLAISDQSESAIEGNLARHGLHCEEGPFDLGEVSFHYGWTFHRARGNSSGAPRAVMTVIYIEDGAKVSPPQNEVQERDLAHWMPGMRPGDGVSSPLNPVLFP